MTELSVSLEALGSESAETLLPALRRLAGVPAAGGALRLEKGLHGRLVELLGHGVREVRREVAGVLEVCAREDPGMQRALSSALGNPDPAVRWGAAFALGRAGLGDSVVAGVADEALEDADGDLRWAALELLVSMSGAVPEAVRRMESRLATGSAAGRKMSLLGLDRCAEVTPERVLEVLRDPDSIVRLAALKCVGAGSLTGFLSDPEECPRKVALREGLEALALNDPNAGVRRAATAILGRAYRRCGHGAEALASLAASGGDGIVVRTARSALGI